MTVLFVSAYICIWSFHPADPNVGGWTPTLQMSRVYVDQLDNGELTLGTGGGPDLKNGFVYPITRGGEYVCE